jgi:hypothetical protein
MSDAMLVCWAARPLCILIVPPWFLLAARENRVFLRFFFIHEHF